MRLILQLIADGFAANGFKTVVPDILNDDPILESNFKDPNWNRQAWAAKHGPESWQGVVDAVVAALKEEGVTRIGTTGYCFGAPPAFHLAFKNEAHVTVVTHPSRLVVPDDFEVSPCSVIFASAAKIKRMHPEIQVCFESTSPHKQLRG